MMRSLCFFTLLLMTAAAATAVPKTNPRPYFEDMGGGEWFGCAERLESEVRERQKEYQHVFRSVMASVSTAPKMADIIESFFGMKYLQWRLTECGHKPGYSESVFDGFPAVQPHFGNSTDEPSAIGLTRNPGPTSEVAQSLSEQCSALADLYDSTRGPQWVERKGWTDRSAFLVDCCDAYGVTCDTARQSINMVQLIANNLRGPIPSSIGRLFNLTRL